MQHCAAQVEIAQVRARATPHRRGPRPGRTGRFWAAGSKRSPRAATAPPLRGALRHRLRRALAASDSVRAYASLRAVGRSPVERLADIPQQLVQHPQRREHSRVAVGVLASPAGRHRSSRTPRSPGKPCRAQRRVDTASEVRAQVQARRAGRLVDGEVRRAGEREPHTTQARTARRNRRAVRPRPCRERYRPGRERERCAHDQVPSDDRVRGDGRRASRRDLGGPDGSGPAGQADAAAAQRRRQRRRLDVAPDPDRGARCQHQPGLHREDELRQGRRIDYTHQPPDGVRSARAPRAGTYSPMSRAAPACRSA